MIPRLLVGALVIFAAFTTVACAQPTSSGAGNNQKSEYREAIVADAAEATRQEALKSHPEQMRVQLRLLAGQLNAAGLTDEVDIIQALEQRIKNEHFQVLMDAHRRALADAFEPQFSLNVLIVELQETDETIAELNELVGTRNPSAAAVTAGVLETARIAEWIEKQKKLGQVKVLSEEKVPLLSGRAAVLQHGSNIDLQSLQGHRSQGKKSDEKPPEKEFIGTSIRATLKLAPEGVIQLSSATETSSISPANKAGRVGIHRNRFQAVSELREGQSLLISGVKSTGNAAEATQIPVLGDIPVVGSRLFTSRKVVQVTHHLMFLATPQIVMRSTDDPHSGEVDVIQPASLSRPAK